MSEESSPLSPDMQESLHRLTGKIGEYAASLGLKADRLKATPEPREITITGIPAEISLALSIAANVTNGRIGDNDIFMWYKEPGDTTWVGLSGASAAKLQEMVKILDDKIREDKPITEALRKAQKAMDAFYDQVTGEKGKHRSRIYDLRLHQFDRDSNDYIGIGVVPPEAVEGLGSCAGMAGRELSSESNGRYKLNITSVEQVEAFTSAIFKLTSLLKEEQPRHRKKVSAQSNRGRSK